MHDHDLDLIASLADGSLDDQTEARARVETCQECRREYESQVSVLAALAQVQPATLTEIEKAALHRDLWTELRLEPAGKTTATPWWYRLSYAAAGLFVVVGLVAVVSQLGTGGDEVAESFAEVSSGLDEGSDGAAETPTPAQNFSGETTPEDASDTTIAAADSAGTTLEATADFEALALETRQNQLPAADRAVTVSDEQGRCLSEAGLENQTLMGTVERERTYLIAVPADTDLDTDTPVSFVDAATCEVIHVED
jgi:hypothetical protein